MEIISVRIKEKSWIAKLAATKLNSSNCAIVIFKTIYLHNISKESILNNTSLLRHETMHVLQWKKMGAFIFLYKYILYSLRYGYYNNPLEIEAREAENDESILKNILIK